MLLLTVAGMLFKFVLPSALLRLRVAGGTSSFLECLDHL